METMATTSESADKSAVSEVFKCRNFFKDKGPTNNIGAVIAASANTCLLYGQPGEKPADEDLSMTVLIHISSSIGCSCNQLEPCLDSMAPETVMPGHANHLQKHI